MHVTYCPSVLVRPTYSTTLYHYYLYLLHNWWPLRISYLVRITKNNNDTCKKTEEAILIDGLWLNDLAWTTQNHFETSEGQSIIIIAKKRSYPLPSEVVKNAWLSGTMAKVAGTILELWLFQGRQSRAGGKAEKITYFMLHIMHHGGGLCCTQNKKSNIISAATSNKRYTKSDNAKLMLKVEKTMWWGCLHMNLKWLAPCAYPLLLN